MDPLSDPSPDTGLANPNPIIILSRRIKMFLKLKDCFKLLKGRNILKLVGFSIAKTSYTENLPISTNTLKTQTL